MRSLYYFFAMSLLLANTGMVYAQADTPSEQRLPIDPPPPPSMEMAPFDEALDAGPIIVEGDKREEFRSNGKLYMVKVTPKDAPPYYLVDREGLGQFTRYNTFDEAKLVVPQWVILTF